MMKTIYIPNTEPITVRSKIRMILQETWVKLLMMTNQIAYIFLISLVILLTFTSCEEADSNLEWGEALIYMPQANYTPYEVPNAGTDAKTNKHYSIDTVNNKVNVFLGVYRSGLQELKAYTVDVGTDTSIVAGSILLPSDKYSLVKSVTCPNGKRDQTFYLIIDTDFLKLNKSTNYSLTVKISNPTNYTLNPDLTTTKVFIKPSKIFTN